MCGELAVYMSKEVGLNKGMCKSQTAKYPVSKNAIQKRKWAIIMVFVLNALPVLENSVSTEWVFHWQHRLAYQLIVQDTA